VANTDCEGLSFPHIFIFYPFITFYLDFYPIYFTVAHRLYLRNPVTWLCISFNLIIPFFLNNATKIRNAVTTGFSPFIFLFVYPTSIDGGWSEQRKYVALYQDYCTGYVSCVRSDNYHRMPVQTY